MGAPTKRKAVDDVRIGEATLGQAASEESLTQMLGDLLDNELRRSNLQGDEATRTDHQEDASLTQLLTDVLDMSQVEPFTAIASPWPDGTTDRNSNGSSGPSKQLEVPGTSAFTWGEAR